MVHLQEVLHHIKAAGLTINPNKCLVAHREVEYLGFITQSFPVPTTKRKVRGFLGLVGWYRKFIPRIQREQRS